MSECSALDWEDYNYAPPAGGAGGRKGAGRSDPLASICDGLPGLEAADIAALLRDLPIPTPGVVPGMTVEEAIEVCMPYNMIYTMTYSMLYSMLYTDIYIMLYTLTCIMLYSIYQYI